jgi:hypothetical protein
MTITGDITLMEHSTAGNAPKLICAQRVEIHHVRPIVQVGVDGFRSEGAQPSDVIWHGGTPADLSDITDIKIVDGHGATLIDGELCRTYGLPRDVPGGVSFQILRAAR